MIYIYIYIYINIYKGKEDVEKRKEKLVKKYQKRGEENSFRCDCITDDLKQESSACT